MDAQITIAERLVLGLEAYLALGAVLGALFVVFGAGRTDPRTRGGSVLFRLVILPGCALLWPYVVYRWARTLAAVRA